MNRNVMLAAILLFSSGRQGFAGQNSGTLTLYISGLENNRGQVVANLFCKGQDVLKIENACQRVHAKIDNKRADIVFHDLAYGTYAISVFQDENNNGTLDHNLLHLPAEPLGFSSGFRLGLFSGLPSFEKLAFTFSKEIDILDIKLR